MNCINHPDRERSAFCQNCGRPLCTECIRSVGSSVFCEPCFVARAAAPPRPVGYGYAAVAGGPALPGGPKPGLAALLGFIPGVGAMYNGQYAKGIVHLMVFAVLVSLADNVNDIFGLFVAGWIAYMVIEAHHTARARRDGTPLPNPFGLNDLSERLGFGPAWPAAESSHADSHAPYAPPADAYTPPAASDAGQPVNAPPYSYQYDSRYTPPVTQWGAPSVPPPAQAESTASRSYSDRFPSGAIWLIALGVFFLVGKAHLFFFRGRIFAPVLVIGFGVWLFFSRMLRTGRGLGDDGSGDYRWRLYDAAQNSSLIVLTGVIWLLGVLHIFPWTQSWPLYLIAAGLLAIFRRAAEQSSISSLDPQMHPANSEVRTGGEPGTAIQTSRTDITSGPASTPGDDREGR